MLPEIAGAMICHWFEPIFVSGYSPGFLSFDADMPVPSAEKFPAM
ncbi:hypothetical protein [Actinocrinis sp.]|nr:hypothetical protein [Actinocrinis sp.]HZP51086.1 hypothetical protein [Actinocrinis sp.]